MNVGDKVIRMLIGKIAMPLVIGEIDDEFIYAGGKKEDYDKGKCWKFRITTLAEVDEYLGWDGISITGSYLLPEKLTGEN